MVQMKIPGSDWAENRALHVLHGVRLRDEAKCRRDTRGLRLQLLHTQDTGLHQASLCSAGEDAVSLQEKVLPRAVLSHNQLWRPPQPLADQAVPSHTGTGKDCRLFHSDTEETSQVWLNTAPAQSFTLP